jgi:cyclic pyranopterin monophosphate synthase
MMQVLILKQQGDCISSRALSYDCLRKRDNLPCLERKNMEECKHSQQSADDSVFRMIDVGAKPPTRRLAVAQGTIHLSKHAFRAIQQRTNPKGDVLALAEVAGIMAAKRTADFIPLCHPLALEYVRVHCELDAAKNTATVFCETATVAKTGVEMEALCGVNGALLAIYDLSKAVDPVLSISDIRLNLKEGGKSGRWVHPDYAEPDSRSLKVPGDERLLKDVPVAVITVSDRASAGNVEDRSGPAIAEFLVRNGGQVTYRDVIADEQDLIRRAIRCAVGECNARLVVTTGGTGLSPRDVTPEAVTSVCDRLIPGIGELLRDRGAMHSEHAYLSRSVAGLFGKALVVALPGSTKAVTEGVEALKQILPHALHIAQGGDHG